MSFLVGTWTLLENSGSYEGFLHYYGYNWLSRKAALAANANVTFTNNIDGKQLTRKIVSSFLTEEEFYYLDGKSHKTPKGLTKTHTVITKNILKSVISMGSITWTEYIQVIGNILFLSREWCTSDGEKLSCRSRFEQALT